jgi:diguanylate cyclase (GGDEF)-like protein
MLIGPDPVAAGQTLPDSAWKDLAAVILRGLRGLDLAARLDATRFAILMPGTDAQGAQRAAERLCQDIALERLRFGPERRQGLTCSVGVAAGHAEDASGLLPLANAALDEAIRNGPSAAHGRSMTAAA